MRRLTILFAAVTIAMTSCNNTTGNKETPAVKPETPPAPPASSLTADGTGKLMAVMTDYYGLKNALVASDTAKASAAAGKLTASATEMSAALQTDTAHAAVMQPYLDTMQAEAKKIVAGTGDIEQKRAAFGKVSDAMFAVLKDANLKNAHVYRQFCPMAFNEKGAYWLSDESEIKNPYYGKKMLDCGEVRDSLK